MNQLAHSVYCVSYSNPFSSIVLTDG
jgi:hypothetical protein